MSYYIGLDIGGTNLAAAVVNENFEIVHKQSRKTGKERPYEEVRDDIVELILDLKKSAGITDVEWVGIGCPGTCNSSTGLVEYSNNLGWHNAPLVHDVSEALGHKVFFDNDANAAAYGEFVAGAAKGANSAVVITLGTGVGSGIIIDKKILRGENFAGAELGHAVIAVDGPLCSCGRHGCFETFSSATGLVRMSKEALDKHPNSRMRELAETDGRLSARTAFIAARMGDEAGLQVVEDYIKYLAAGIANAINIFQPDFLCIGGGVCNEGEYLMNPLKELVKQEVYASTNDKHTEIVVCSLGNDAGIVGAAALGLNN